jgi:hypothetical protein
MTMSGRNCAIETCKMYSCAVCHCCNKDLCLEHLQQHRDQLHDQFSPLVHQINVLIDYMNKFSFNESASCQLIECWRARAHQEIDKFCERQRQQLLFNKLDQPREQLEKTKIKLDRILQKQGATRENLVAFTNAIDATREQLIQLDKCAINLRAFVIDEKAICLPVCNDEHNSSG